MNDLEVSKQVQQMVQFIKQEAEEKAHEIAVTAEEEFNIEKLQLVEAAKRAIRSEYERKEKQVEIAKKIDYSKQLNASRLKVLQAQDVIVQGLLETATKDLAKVSQHRETYATLLKDLIQQGLTRLGEKSVLLRCREVDLHLVKQVVENLGSAATSIEVDSKKFLPVPPGHEKEGQASCAGGIVMATADSRVVCSNTLDARLEIAFKQNLPMIRKALFKTSVYSG
eukprot:TRINITY_DN9787_c0_g1_i1.p1 TRINITY_DN9787_c0_g1~~TRINITY_DN9787_c0_g1_i1.p1  ORF type:complete len:236 (-),score=58.90 TRINITY_DN9787_c0_g1_i1:622-1296(-)